MLGPLRDPGVYWRRRHGTWRGQQAPADKRGGEGVVEQNQLETERLTLLALDAEQLRRCLEGPEALEQDLGLVMCQDLVGEAAREAIMVKHQRMTVAPMAEYPWHTYWLMIARDVQMGIGLAGFKGTPSSQGIAEVGYSTCPAYRNRGYMTEAVRALIGWAFQQPRCKTIFADTDVGNVASQRVLEKSGLRRFGRAGDMYLWRLDRAEVGEQGAS